MPLALSSSYPLAGNIKLFVAVDEGNVLKDLVTPSRTITPNTTGPNPASFGTGTWGRHFRTGGGLDAGNGAAMSPAFLAPVNNTGTLVVVTHGTLNAQMGGGRVWTGYIGAASALGNGGLTIPVITCSDAGKVQVNGNAPGGFEMLLTGTSDYIVGANRMLAYTRNGENETKLYVNAALEATGTFIGGNSVYPNALFNRIGGDPTFGFTDARIVYILWFDVVLTQQQLTDLYASLAPDNNFAPLSADVTAPDITSTGTGSTNGPFAANCAENSAGVCITLTSSEALSTVIKGTTPDDALFTLGGSGLTRTLTPTSPFDFENLPHANPFVVTLDFKDSAAIPNTRPITLNISVTNVNEPPGPPTIGTATPAASGSVSVTFTAPNMTGKPSITGYTVTASPGGATGTGLSSPITVSGLTNGTAYTFTATATNMEGTGAPSAASNSATPVASPPGVFTSEVLKRNDGTVAANISLTYVRFYNPSSGALVLSKAGLSTNSSGVFAVTDAALAGATNYALDWLESGGQRRMPIKAAA